MTVLLNIASAQSGQQADIRNALVISHNDVELFGFIPDSLLPLISANKLVFRHASVGTTINDGLECIQGTKSSPVECTLFTDYKYDRRKWIFQSRPNSGWYGKINDFLEEVNNQLDSSDLFMFKFCYLDGLDGLMEPCGSPFDPVRVQNAWYYLRDKMDSLENKHPQKRMIWVTIPLTQVGQFCTDTLNTLIRNYCMTNNKVLFDIADIQCHDSSGILQTNAQGWEIAYKPFCGEQQPGAQACHPNWPGKLRIASAFWLMMARLTGFNPAAIIINPEEEETEYGIFPNPATNRFYLAFLLKKDTELSISLHDNSGRISVMQQKQLVEAGHHCLEITLPELRQGFYYLKVQTPSSCTMKKIIVCNQ